MKTFSPKPRDIERRWYVIDAQGAVLGRLASEVAKLLRGKHKPIFAPHADTGDHVIVVNARGIRLTGAKEQEKLFYRHSGYPGGLRQVNYARLMAERPRLAVEKAVRGMLPKNRLGRQMITKLAVYEGPTHPHEAQKPVALELGRLPKWEGLPKAAMVPSTAPEASKTVRRTRRVGAPKTGAAGAVRARGSRRSRPATAAKGKTSATTESTRAAAEPRRRRSGSTGAGEQKRAAGSGRQTDTVKKPARSRARKTTKES